MKKPFIKRASFWISVIVALSVIFLTVQIIRINILPANYMFGIVSFIYGFALLGIGLANFSQNTLVKIMAYLVCANVFIVSSFGSYFLSKTILTLHEVAEPIHTTSDDKTIRFVKAFSLNDFSEKTVEDMNGQTVGILRNHSREQVDTCVEKIKQEKGINFTLREYDSSIEMMNNLKGKVIDFIIIDEPYLTTIEDYSGYEDIVDHLYELYAYDYKVTNKDVTKTEVDVTNTPFTVLISGSDSRIGLEEVTRSDVNMVLVVNPNINTLLMISIPRDYYVETACDASLGCANGKMDKLTHTGLHGIGTTEATIEKFLDIDINYNATVTFDTVTQLVDALGGITIGNSQEVELDGFLYEVGNIKVNGKQALRYARERKSYASGDRQRGRNQMAVVKGIVNKMLSKQLLMNFGGIMDAVAGTFRTNLSVKDMTRLVNKQISEMKSWKIYQISLDGSNGTDFAYELGDNASVMYPNEETIHKAQLDIQAMFNGETPPFKNE
ncbi:MAG: LCP family protein [Firmicutes bacterium]|nr:LCP family protein [Bacillota bacterium]